MITNIYPGLPFLKEGSKRNIKLGIISLLVLAVSGCSSVIPVVTTGPEIIKLRQTVLDTGRIVVAEVSKNKGAGISFRIDSSLSSLGKRGAGGEFLTKANANGTPGPGKADIKSYKLYLIKSSTPAFPANGDPLNASNIVFGPVNVDVNLANGIDFQFTGVPGSTASFGTGDYYHIAVRAFDTAGGTGTELLKSNASWTGTTAATPKVAVSSGTGIQVLNSDLSVSSTTPLSITLDMEPGTGAKANVMVDLNGEIADDVKSYTLNLCTDPTRPVTTKVFSTDLTVNAGSSDYFNNKTHPLNIGGIPAGTYYAYVSAYNDVAAGGTNVTKKNNNGTAYAGSDLDSRVAVSTNTVTVNNNLKYSFSSGEFFDINLNLSTYIWQTSVILDGSDGLINPERAALDNDGNIYIAEFNENAIKKFDGNTITTLLDASDGVSSPMGIAVDSSGNIYFSEYSAGVIKKFDGTTLTTIISSGIDPVMSLSIDSSDTLYFADFYNNTIKKFDGTTITTLLNSGFNRPMDVETDSSGNIYIADRDNNSIKKFDGTTVTTLVNTGLNEPYGIGLDTSGNVYIADYLNGSIKLFDGSTTTTILDSSDGLFGPTDVIVKDNYIYIVENTSNKILKAEKVLD